MHKRFSARGEITDIQLRKDKRNAYIGFKTSDQANECVEYFDKTFIYTSKISVKVAQAFRIKKVELNDVPSVEEPKPKVKFDPFEDVKNEEEFKEFIQLQRNISKLNAVLCYSLIKVVFKDLGKGKEIWKDDVADIEHKPEEENPKNEEDIESEEEQVDEQNGKTLKKSFEFTVKLKGLPCKIKKRQLKDFFLPVKPISLRFVPRVKGIAYASFKNEKDLNQALIKHRGFIDGHRIDISRYNLSLADSNKSNNQKGSKAKQEPKWKNAQPPAEPLGETGRIYVRNLPYSCTDEDLRVLFEKYGPLTELHMPICSITKKPKGFAFVTYMLPEHAVKAFNELDKTNFQGRLIHLLSAHAKVEFSTEPSDVGSLASSNKSEFKTNKQEELKKEANNPVNWNTLFIRTNAVADVMTKKFNVNKLDLLTQSSKKDNVAVRMALGETQIVNEVRDFLKKSNVCLDSFSRGHDCARSNTVILVKNLPAEADKEEISALFEKFGLVNQVILPPYGVIINKIKCAL